MRNISDKQREGERKKPEERDEIVLTSRGRESKHQHEKAGLKMATKKAKTARKSTGK